MTNADRLALSEGKKAIEDAFREKRREDVEAGLTYADPDSEALYASEEEFLENSWFAGDHESELEIEHGEIEPFFHGIMRHFQPGRVPPVVEFSPESSGAMTANQQQFYVGEKVAEGLRRAALESGAPEPLITPDFYSIGGRELVVDPDIRHSRLRVTHEAAHFLAPRQGHGPVFRYWHLRVVEFVFGREAAEELASYYSNHDLEEPKPSGKED